MKLLFNRLIGCTLGLLAGCFLFNTDMEIRQIIICVVLMTIFFTYLRPLINLIILPFNIFLLGILGLFADALLVYWAAGRNFGYLQALFIAVIIALCYLPYKKSKFRFWRV